MTWDQRICLQSVSRGFVNYSATAEFQFSRNIQAYGMMSALLCQNTALLMWMLMQFCRILADAYYHIHNDSD